MKAVYEVTVKNMCSTLTLVFNGCVILNILFRFPSLTFSLTDSYFHGITELRIGSMGYMANNWCSIKAFPQNELHGDNEKNHSCGDKSLLEI